MTERVTITADVHTHFLTDHYVDRARAAGTPLPPAPPTSRTSETPVAPVISIERAPQPASPPDTEAA